MVNITRSVKLRYRIFFFNDTATTEIYTLSLHDALPICQGLKRLMAVRLVAALIPYIGIALVASTALPEQPGKQWVDRKSTRLNSSHPSISYAVFCLKKKKKTLKQMLRD